MESASCLRDVAHAGAGSPHPALRATFSRGEKVENALPLNGCMQCVSKPHESTRPGGRSGVGGAESFEVLALGDDGDAVLGDGQPACQVGAAVPADVEAGGDP